MPGTASDAGPARTREPRLFVYVGLGLLFGLADVVFDALSEARLGQGRLTGTLADAHAIVDRTLPILLGGLLGVFAHYMRLRKELATVREIAGRSDALRSRLQKVERDQAVWVLAAAVLHELNNPLHAMGLLLDEVDAIGSGRQEETRRRDLLLRARVQFDRALTHLHALRSMHHRAEPAFEQVALERVAGALAQDVGPLAAEDGLEVRLDCARPVHACADAGYVRTILENLVDNSMHSLRLKNGRGTITIRVCAEAGRAVVQVLDDGPGMDPEVRGALFEPLRTTKTQGLGLGLPIARALARSMRGELSFHDRGGKAFRLELPLALA